VWKVNGTERTKVTAPQQIQWGDRVAIRVTGIGKGQQELTDDAVSQTQDFTPAVAAPVYLGAVWGGKTLALTPVAMTWAPDGLAGVVEVVVDLPATQSPDYWWQFFVPENRPAGARVMLWPFDGGPGGA
jgi:hypothetical protein